MSVPVVDSKQPRSSSSQVSQATHVKDGAAQDIERASIHSEGTEFSPAGVNRISAFYDTFSSWPKLLIFGGAFLAWVFAYSLSADTTFVFLPFATSDYGQHSLIGLISTVCLITAAVVQPFWSKIADLFSRPLALTGGLVFYVVGYAIVSGSHNVQTVAAGQVIYTLGTSGMSFMQTLIIGDITPLRHRGLALGIAAAPYIPFAFAAGPITDAVSLTNWRWGFGMFCIIMTACVVPIIAVLFWADWKAIKEGKLSVAAASIAYQTGLLGENTPPTLFGKLRRAASIIDAFGLLLLAFCFALLLAPTTLSTTASNGWKNPSLIAMQTIGGVLFLCFCIWEWKIAANPILPRRMMNKTFCICLCLNFFYYLIAYFTDVYWSSWLYVIRNDLSTQNYTYMNQIATITLCLFGLIAGALQSYLRRYKWLQVTGLGIRIIGSGLNYYSSLGNNNIATIFFAKFLLSAGGGIMVIGSQIAAQASVKHKDLALSIAILSLFTQVGGAIASAISATIWNNNLPTFIARYCPNLTPEEVTSVFGDITVAAVTEPREGIVKAYNEAYRLLSLPALICIFVPFIVACFSTNYVLDDRHNAVEDKVVVVRPGGAGDQAAVLAAADQVQTELTHDDGKGKDVEDQPESRT